jgi:hypothetical protein
MLDDCFIEQEYTTKTGIRTVKDTTEPIRLEKLDFRHAPTNFVHFSMVILFHFIYFHLLGPVIAIFMLFTSKTRKMIYNMHILRFSLPCLEGIVCFALTILLIICHHRNNNSDAQELEAQDDETYSVCLYNKVLIYILRILIIANKYATLGDHKMSQLNLRTIDN